MSIETRMNNNYDELNQNDKDILSYILSNKNEVSDMTITSLANLTLTSKSTIMRLAKKLEYSGYSELKYDLQYQIPKNNIEERQSFTSLQEIDIEQTRKLFDQMNIMPLLKKLYSANRIFCYGTGWGQMDVLSDFSRSMVNHGKFPILLSHTTELGTASKSMDENDIVIIVSLSGEIKEAKNAMESLILRHVPILSITDLRNNKFASIADYNLYFQTNSIEHSGEEITSLIPLYIITDLIFRSYTDYVMKLENN